MREIIKHLVRHKGIARARAVMDQADGRSESGGETRVREIFLRMGYPTLHLQYEVDTRFGRFRIDLAWPDLKLAIEFDGNMKYFDYKPTDEVILLERKREKALMEEGWTFLRLEWPDLDNEQRLHRRIEQVISRAEALQRVA